MRKSIAMLAIGMLLVVGGCKSDSANDGSMNSSSEPKKMTTDACAHCPGVQTATADGKCPVCGAKAANNSMAK
jgi:hypothetical protein